MYNMENWCQRLIRHEGLKLNPYRCPQGKLTIGVGRNLETNPLTAQERRAVGDYMHGITENAAKMLLRNDIKRCFESLKRTVKDFETLTPDRQYALVDMCFQLGVKGLKRFHKMLNFIEEKKFSLAAAECLNSAYARQTPQRAKKIAQTLKTGIW